MYILKIYHIVPLHSGILSSNVHFPVPMPSHVFVACPMAINPGGHTKVQTLEIADFSVLQVDGTYFPKLPGFGSCLHLFSVK